MDTQIESPIRTYRRDNSLTLEQFGALVGVKKAAVSKWEGGRAPPPIKAIEIERVTNGELPKHLLRPDLWQVEAAE